MFRVAGPSPEGALRGVSAWDSRAAVTLSSASEKAEPGTPVPSLQFSELEEGSQSSWSSSSRTLV